METKEGSEVDSRTPRHPRLHVVAQAMLLQQHRPGLKLVAELGQPAG